MYINITKLSLVDENLIKKIVYLVKRAIYFIFRC